MDYKFVLHTQRNELMRKLQKYTVPLFSSGIFSIYEHVKKTNKVKKYLLKEFQKSLVDISVWSKELLRNEHTRFVNIFPMFDKVVAKIFDTQMGMHGKNTSPIDTVDFLHQCYLNIARSVWKQPFLVYDVGVDKIMVQKNKLKIEKLIGDCIVDTFDHFLPFDDDDNGQEVDRDAETEVHEYHNLSPNPLPNQTIEQSEEDILHYPEEQVEQQEEEQEPFTEFEEECASTINVDDFNDINDTNQTPHETESFKDDFEEQFSLEEESEDFDIDNDDLSIETSTDVDAFSDNEDKVVIRPDTQHLPDVQNTQDTLETTFDTQFTQGAPETPDLQDVHNDLFVVKLDENESKNIPQINNELNITHELTEENLKNIDLHCQQPFHTNHVLPNTGIITPTDTPRDNVKIVNYDDKAGKVKSLLSLKKKVKSSMLNTHMQNPSFF